MNKPIAIVTGSSSGFGLLTTLELAKSGFHVIATMRNPEKSSTLISEANQLHLQSNITIHQLDVTSQDSINQIDKLMETFGRIDVLVNNAGYAAAGFIEELPMEEYRKQFETNVFGVMAVTKAVLPTMRKQRQGKIINLSSISGVVAFPGMSPYVASKHALEGWSECLRLEMKPFGVDVILVEPGSYKTNIWSTGKQITRTQLDSPYHSLMEGMENYIQLGAEKFGDPREVAEIIANIAKMQKPSLRFPMGKGVKTTIFLKNLIPWSRWESILLNKLPKRK